LHASHAANRHAFKEQHAPPAVLVTPLLKSLCVRNAGPISLADISRKQLAFAALPYARTNAEKHSIRVSSSIATS